MLKLKAYHARQDGTEPFAVRTILELRPMPDGGLSASYLVPRLANPAYDQTGLKY